MIFGEWMEGLLRRARAAFDASAPPPVVAAVAPAAGGCAPQTPAGAREWLDARSPFRARADALTWLLERVGARDPAGVEDAAREVRDALGGLSPRELARVDQDVRMVLLHWDRPEPPRWLRPAGVRALEVPDELAAWVLGLLSFHPNGYVREAAVERLAGLTGGDELPFLLLRANDWVEPVRRRATGAVRARLAPENAARFVRELPLVLRLEESGRGDHAPLVQAVLALLRTPDVRRAVLAGLESDDARVRRASFQVLAGAGEGLREVVELGLGSPDPVVRRRAAREASRLDGAALAELVPVLMRDRLAAVRLEGAMLAGRLGPGGGPWLRAAAFDRSAMVRAAGRASLSPGSPRDFAREYRAALESGGAPREGALPGLGETGGADDVALAARFLADPLPRVRAAAVEAAARLGRDAAVPLVMPLLGDASWRVSRAARVALERRAAAVDEGALAALFAADRPAHVRRNALALLARRSKWEALPWILRATADADPVVAAHARAWLNRWRARFNRTFVAPAPDQLARADAALHDAGDRVDDRTRGWLRSVARLP